MAHLSIIPATLADAPALSELIQRTIRRTNAADYDPAEIELVCESFAPERIAEIMSRRAVYLAKQDATPVGTVSLGDGKLHALFVDPDLQGQGLGQRLVGHVEARARTCGLQRLEVSSSITALPFYERLGYRLIEFEPRKIGATYLMWKKL
ncbi:MAG: GNAT family N-acetyltransferase [Pseudomonadota bacterium]